MNSDKKREDQQDKDAKDDKDDNEGRSILIEDQTSFVDEHSRAGKQFGDARKVADLERVGAFSPDTDADEEAEGDDDEDPSDSDIWIGRAHGPVDERK